MSVATTERETQQTISAWAEETFGPAGSLPRIAARANEEMAELLRGLTFGAEPEKLVEEAADVKIVLYRLAERVGRDLDGSMRTLAQPVSDPSAALWRAAKASIFLSEAILCFALQEDYDGGVLAVRAVEQLDRLAQAYGLSLDDAVSAKMAINRARQWKLDGSGHGYHVKPAAEGQ